VVSGRCKKRDILAVFLERDEDEIVVPGSLVRGRIVTPQERVVEPPELDAAAA
jgi:hypothetical protein